LLLKQSWKKPGFLDVCSQFFHDFFPSKTIEKTFRANDSRRDFAAKGAHLSSDQTPGGLGWNMVELFMGCCMLIKLETEISNFCRYNGCDIKH
jgi:hypothetical protein